MILEGAFRIARKPAPLLAFREEWRVPLLRELGTVTTGVGYRYYGSSASEACRSAIYP